MRIALIHALGHSIAPSNEAFGRLWPEASLMNLLDDSLAADLVRSGGAGAEMTERFLHLTGYARDCGADGILFTCSAFGPCIEACAREFAPLPVLKPNEAMIEDAVAAGTRIGLLASFAPTLAFMPAEFAALAPAAQIVPALVAEALSALDAGDPERHDWLAAQASGSLTGCELIALAQFSLARAAPMVAAATGRPVLTTPESAVRKLRRVLHQ
jgi:Asp/Glu/hydantoin racemase